VTVGIGYGDKRSQDDQYEQRKKQESGDEGGTSMQRRLRDRFNWLAVERTRLNFAGIFRNGNELLREILGLVSRYVPNAVKNALMESIAV